jgi:hypothetical protein
MLLPVSTTARPLELSLTMTHTSESRSLLWLDVHVSIVVTQIAFVLFSRAVCSHAKRTMPSFLLLAVMIVLHAGPASAQHEFAPSSVEKSVLLVSSPSLSDPNFHQTVLFIVEHRRGKVESGFDL